MSDHLHLPARVRIETASGTVLSGPLVLGFQYEDLMAQTEDGREHLIMSDCPYGINALEIMVEAWDNNPVNSAYGHMHVPFSLN